MKDNSMSETFNMVILTRSAKNGGSCVAGICTQNGHFVRLVTDDIATHGAVKDRDLIMDNGKIANVLDVIRVRDAEYSPSDIQPENYMIDRSKPFEYLGYTSIDDVLKHYPAEAHSEVFSGNSHKMSYDEVASIGHSLELIRVQRLQLYKADVSGTLKTKAQFVIDGVVHMNYSVTDRNYYNQNAQDIGDAYIVCSFADDDWSKENGYYKYVCAIYPI